MLPIAEASYENEICIGYENILEGGSRAMSLEEKSADAAAPGNDDGGEESSAIAAGIRRDVKPWLNLVDDLSNLTRDAEISVPQVGRLQGCVFIGLCVVGPRNHPKSGSRVSANP